LLDVAGFMVAEASIVAEASMVVEASMMAFVAGRALGALADFVLGSGGRGSASVSVGLDILTILTGIILARNIRTRTAIRMRCLTGTRLIRDAA
jgi:hypothetical protein